VNWAQLGQTSYVIASCFQVVAIIFGVRMVMEVKDRRPWLVLVSALLIMLVFRILRMYIAPEVMDHYSPLSAMVISVLLFISMFYIRTIAVAERESEKRYRSLVELSPDVIFVNANDQISYINAAGLKFFGAMSEQQLIGKSPLEFMSPESAGTARSRIADLFSDREMLPVVEEQWIRLDGSRVTVEAVASLIPWQGTNAIQVVLRDISERKRAENEKARLLASERVARSNAEHANRMKDEFLATLSHELRTPLNAILGWSQLLRGGQSEPDELNQGLDTIERNARAQTQLIEDLLDMSRIISGKLRLDIQKVVPSAFIKAAIETIRPAAEAKGVRIEQVIDPLAGPVSGDPNRLQQIAWNLLSNAVKFTPRGGKVQVLLQRVNSHIEMTVSDSGQGINAEFLPFIFERFRQADASTTRRHGGLGLGLSIVKQLVDLHGGAVFASSPGEGQGSTFVVHLPLSAIQIQTDDGIRLHPATETAASSHLSEAQTNLAGLKVLVVDDEPDARELIRRVLKNCDAEVVTASSGEEALKLIDGTDVLISDIGMPEMDGYELLKRVRGMTASRSSKIPAIALTAFARSEDRTRALMAGYQVHISKPVSTPELIASVASVTGRTEHSSPVNA
jgi:PAS domain S-box-containing protein